MIRSGQSAAFPRSNGEMSRPSSGLSPTRLMPAKAVSVGNRSMAPVISFTTVPGRIPPAGQRRKNTERTPPSSVEPLMPFIPPFQRQAFGPLSEK